MTEKQLCNMCTEYSTEVKCEHRQDCELLNILRENKELKKQLRQTKKNYEESKALERWEKYPDQMGRW